MPSTIIVLGDPNLISTCISSASRPFPAHCWIRAAVHIPRMSHVNYFEKMEAVAKCLSMAEAVAKEMKAPQRVEAVPGFTWH